MRSFKNARLLKAISKQPLDRTPVWIMRQAGRYLPEYRATREKAGSFMRLCQTPELACEVTLQPLRRYPLDASIIFSDILTIPDAMGLGVNFQAGEGPVLNKDLKSAADIQNLTVPDLSKLEYVYDAIKLVVKELDGNIPLIGFCGSPWTLAAYMVEGRSVPGFPSLFALMHSAPALLHQLLTILAQGVTAHLKGQIAAGVSVVMLFDTWGGLLNNVQYQTFSLNYMRQIIAGLGGEVPCILFTKGGGAYLTDMAAAGAQMLGIDWEISLQAARSKVGDKVALQGNLHPQVLLSSPAIIREKVAEVLASYGQGSGHVFNLGHGITPEVPPENVQVLIETVHELSKAYHEG